MPTLMAIIVEQTPAEFEVFSMRAQWGPGQSPPSIISAVLLSSEHLGHAGPVGASKVKSDMSLVGWQAGHVAGRR